MKIRAVNSSDALDIGNIHEKFYSQEFELPDFTKGFVSSFVVSDTEHGVICAGGVKQILESIIVTNKDVKVAIRREALKEVLKFSKFTAAVNGQRQLHAFLQDEKWIKHLKRYGFKETVGKSLVINV